MRPWLIAVLLLASRGAFAQDGDLPLDPERLEQEALGDDLVGLPDGVFQELALLVRVGNVEARAEAIWRLARLDDDRSVEPITKLVPGCKRELRPFVAMGLGWLGKRATRAAPGLAGFLEDPSEFTRGTTVWALGRMRASDVAKAFDPDRPLEIREHKGIGRYFVAAIKLLGFAIIAGGILLGILYALSTAS